MYEPVEKTPEKKSHMAANAVSQMQNSHAPTSRFVDNRPEAIQMRKLRDLAKNSRQNDQLRELHHLAATHSVAQKQSNGKKGFGFVDKRAEAVAQRVMKTQLYVSPFQFTQKKEDNAGLPDNLKSGIENPSEHLMDDVDAYDIQVPQPQIQVRAKEHSDVDLRSNGLDQMKPNRVVQLIRRNHGIYSSSLTIQRILDEQNVTTKAELFLAAHEEEGQLILQANRLLRAFSENATAETFDAINNKVVDLRDAVSVQTNIQADLLQDYIGTADQAVRKTFMDVVLQKDSSVLKPLFDTLINQTQLGEQVDEKYKRRFLSYVLQGMKFPAGEGRFTELMGLLGNKTVEIKTLLLGPSAGLQDPDVDNPKAEKQDARNPEADADLLEQHEGNLSEFIKARFAGPDTRTSNPAVAGIGDVAVIMEQDQLIFPIYYGHTATKDVQAFTSPMFTAIHHELGHVVNKLKGKAGVYAARYALQPVDRHGMLLKKLTDEEEVYNISIDQHSDKAMSENLGLPERIAHGAIGGLSAFDRDALNKAHLETDLRDWDKWTYQLTPGRHTALMLIKQIADGDWKA